MPGPRPLEITLSETQRAVLERLAKRPTSPNAVARRARMVVLAADGERNEAIARRLGSGRAQVRAWRARWAEAAPELNALEASGAGEHELDHAAALTLADRPRSGRPPVFTAEAVCRILAVACEDPIESGREVTHWTPRELADEAVKRGIVGSISARTVGRFFVRAASSRI